MNTNSYSEAQFILRRALASADVALADRHRWLREEERWHELVIAIISQATTRSDIDIRTATSNLVTAGLLDIAALSAALNAVNANERDVPLLRHLYEVLEDSGFNSEEVETITKALCEVAHGFTTHFQGKVQRYLRHYGELMLSEFPRFFEVSALGETSTRYALTYWLQNTLNMPLSLITEDTKTLCAEREIELSDIAEAADELGMNLALMDDVISCYIAMRKPTAALAPAQ